MIGGDELACLPRRGTLHLIQTGSGVGWTAGAMVTGSSTDLRIAVGPSCVAEFARALPAPFSVVLTAPLGVERLAARRLRAWMVRRGHCPLHVIAYGQAVGALAAKALPTIDRVVHRVPPADAAIDCEGAARGWAQREALNGCGGAMRGSLGISQETLVVIAGGDWASGIDARAAFAVIACAALAGADVTLVVSSKARWVSETRRFARGLEMSHRIVALDEAEVPSALWTIADAMLLMPPALDATWAWWGHCAWWAKAAGMTVICQECAHEVDGTIQVARGDCSAMTLELLDLVTARSAR
ncbi:MAG: hypothetical protein EXS17_04710 [Phycisphaerales bacterium]|nr:hypothetical protein [Phycisphaerales bacterium]